MEDKKENKSINRRRMLKVMGAGIASSAILSGCGKKKNTTTVQETASVEVPIGKMTYRTNPKNGDKISLLGYGGDRWLMLKNPDGSESKEVDQDSINELVDYAIEHGINYFDMAPVYRQGNCEKATGIALRRHPRDKYYLVTKMSNQSFAGKGLSPQDMFRKSQEMYYESFKTLQTDYIDYYMLHTVEGNMDRVKERFFDCGLLDFLLAEREAGRIRNFGFSFHGSEQTLEYMLSLHDKINWDFVQIQLNYYDYHTVERGVTGEYMYGELAKRKIPVIVMAPLLGNRLSNMSNHLVARFKQREPANSVASWAFRFAASFPYTLCVLSGMTYMEHLQENIRTFSPLVPLTEDDKIFLEETAQLLRKYPLIGCNDCDYCMPCPYGIDIPGTFLHYNKCVNEGDVVANEQSDNYKKARRAFLVGYDRSVPKLRQASHCTACGQCTPLCPQHLNIPAQMQRIDKYVEQLKQNKSL